MAFDILAHEKKQFQELSKAVSKQDAEWLISRLVARDPGLADYRKNKKHEAHLLSEANHILYNIEKYKPKDVRAYVENELLSKEYQDKIWSIRNSRCLYPDSPLDEDALGELEKKLNGIENEINKKHPELKEDVWQLIAQAKADIKGKKTGQEMHLMFRKAKKKSES